MNSLPFSIREVGLLCGLKLTAKQANERITCPFCGKRKTMNISYNKGVFHCFGCDERGTQLDLFRKITGVSGTNGEVVREIKQRLNITDDFKPQHGYTKPKSSTKEDMSIDFPAMARADKVYRAFLGKLSLGALHRRKLTEERYMTDADIERWQFKSVPIFGTRYICDELCAEGFSLSGIGGFYLDDTGWDIAISPNSSGFIIPVWNYFGLIAGLQIRLDNPVGRTRYMLISSPERREGTPTKAVPFYCKGTRRSDVLIVTEGFFKAAIPSKIYGYSCMALFGVNNQKEFEKLIPYLKKDGVQYIVEAFDADFRTNDNVRKAKDTFRKLCVTNGFKFLEKRWPPEMGKGLDDYIIALQRKKDSAN